jgi:PII-like signaling protein
MIKLIQLSVNVFTAENLPIIVKIVDMQVAMRDSLQNTRNLFGMDDFAHLSVLKTDKKMAW